jgi:4-diphosphocytidyl-2C-methyl-D-erythritol kinase
VSDLFERTETGAREALQSDLELAALDVVPGLLPWRELLDQNGAEHFRLSGSGSSFFGLFEDVREASACLSAIETEAARRALTPRACRVHAPAGHGVRIASS